MFTSDRVLLLRQDNVDLRLTEKGIPGLNDDRMKRVEEKEATKAVTTYLENESITPKSSQYFRGQQ